MKRMYLVACALVVGTLTGCAHHHVTSKLETNNGDDSKMSMRNVTWSPSGAGIEVVGFGWNDKEDEPDITLFNWPAPFTYRPRWIHITPAGGDQYTIEMLVDPHFVPGGHKPAHIPDRKELDRFTGTATLPTHAKDDVRWLEFHDVELKQENGDATLHVKGNLLAVRRSPEETALKISRMNDEQPW